MQFASTSSKSTRKVYNTELESSDFAMDSPSEVTEDTDYDIDASAITLLANMTNRVNANSDSYLPSEDYSSLSAEERDLWKKIQSSMKSIILKGRNSGNRPSGRFNSNNSNNHSYKSIKPLPLRGKPFTKANLTELLSELIFEIHELEDSSFASENVVDDKESTLLVNLTTTSKLNPGDIRKLLSSPAKSSQFPSPSSAKKVACKTDITINGKVYREVGKHVIYYLSKVSRSYVDYLVDRCANGGVAGNDVRVIDKHPDRTVDVRGINNHEITSIPLVTAGGVTSTTSGEVIVIMHQHAHHGKNKIIHSYPQIEHYENKVDDRYIKVGGSQHITTLDNYKIPTSIRNALPYMPLCPYTDSEWEALSHVVLTSDND